MTMQKGNKLATLLGTQYPVIDPGKSCDQYHREGMDGTPESDAWLKIDSLSENSGIPFEQAAHLILSKALGVKGLAMARQAYKEGGWDPHSQYMCRVVSLSALREENDFEFATDMQTVDDNIGRVLATWPERWSMDLMAHYPDPGLDVTWDMTSLDGGCNPRAERFTLLHDRIDELARSRESEFEEAAFFALSLALGDDGLAEAHKLFDGYTVDEHILYQCRLVVLAFLWHVNVDADGFTLEQVDEVLHNFLSTKGFTFAGSYLN